MSHPLTTVIDIYGPVGFAMLGSGIAWLIKEQRKNRTQLIVGIDELRKVVSKHSNDLQVMEIHRVETDKDVESLMRDFPLVRQNLAILARVVEDHEQWHRDHKAAG